MTHAQSPAEKISPRPERIDIQIPVHLRSRTGSGPGIARNVCPGGLFVSTPRLLAVGDWVIVRFMIPGATEPVEILGEVRWWRPFQDLVDLPSGLGLRFVETPMRATVLALELQRIRGTDE